jgi:hypothetical protein
MLAYFGKGTVLAAAAFLAVAILGSPGYAQSESSQARAQQARLAQPHTAHVSKLRRTRIAGRQRVLIARSHGFQPRALACVSMLCRHYAIIGLGN